MALAAPLAAQDWHLNASGGFGSVSGEYGDLLEKPVSLDLNISKGRVWRFGAGFEFGSMVMKPPYEDQEDWSRLSTYGFVTRVFHHERKVRPYLQGRLGFARIHPRSSILHVIPPEEFAEGHNPTDAANGFGFSLVPGVEIGFNRHVALDLSAGFHAYQTGDLDLSLIGQEPASSGRELQFRAGLTWTPLADGVSESERDAWGIPKSWGWATAEMLGINFVASALNEYTRGESSYPITPRTIQENFERGFKFDDNKFKTNQLIHPFNGGTYYNSARANGIGFWGSSAMAIAGAFLWECCGESQPMSWNDMVSTALGGISRGETSHRLGGMIRDNGKTGMGRFWRELGSFPVDPVGGFNRLLSGRASRTHDNPESPYDWRPPHLVIQMAAGARVIGEGESISENTNTYGLLQLDIGYGSAFDNERRKPFDRFDGGVQLDFGEKSKIGRLQIRGDLWSKPLGGDQGKPPRNVLAVIQDFDYIDNEAYEYGGQAFGLALFSRFGEGRTRLTTRAMGYLVVGAAVNADYSFLAEIPDPRAYRDYDYGAGPGIAAEMALIRSQRLLGLLSYRYTYIDVRNGSLFNPDDPNLQGSSANHQVHRARLYLTLPLGKHLGVGAEYVLFFRDSEYSSPILEDRTQRNPEARLMVTWSWQKGATE